MLDCCGQSPLVVTSVRAHASKEAARNELTRELVRLSSKTERQWVVIGDVSNLQEEGELALSLANGQTTHWDGNLMTCLALHVKEEEAVMIMQSPEGM